MEVLNKKFSMPIEDLTAITCFVTSSLESYLTTFTVYSPDFQEPNLSNYKAKVDLINDIVYPGTIKETDKKNC